MVSRSGCKQIVKKEAPIRSARYSILVNSLTRGRHRSVSLIMSLFVSVTFLTLAGRIVTTRKSQVVFGNKTPYLWLTVEVYF